eukprot:CCRYP_018573-RI/>CCRYP_018573-RI protein AED:0.48 eAED:0.48 QI:0/-1/0/1/-1/0/1/0/25
MPHQRHCIPVSQPYHRHNGTNKTAP